MSANQPPGTDPEASKEGIDLERLLRTLLQRRGLIALCCVLTTVASLGFSLAQRRQYSASASLLFRDPGFDQKLFGSSVLPPSTDPAREAATNSQLVSLETVAARASNALHGRLSPGAISRKISIDAKGESNVVSITATDPSPRLAAKLANAVADQYTAFRRDADRAKIQQAQNLVKAQIDGLPAAERFGTQGRSLQDRADQLSVLASLQTGNAEVVQSARPPASPSSPNKRRNTILGAILGLLLGLGIAFLLERLDRRVRSPGELGEAYGIPVLASIPEDAMLATASEDLTSSGSPAQEAFRMLRARLRYFNVDRQLSSILVTSPAPADGKSTVAWHLARTAAMTRGVRVLLVEADLRRPGMARQHGLIPSPGLAELLTQDIALSDVVQNVPLLNQPGDARAASGLDVLIAGTIPPNPSELMESHAMGEFLTTAKAQYNLIVLDTPPLSVVSDTIPLMGKVDGVVVVSRLDKTTLHSATHLREQLSALNAPVLGVVANRVAPRAGDYYAYAYAYTSHSEHAESDSASPPSTSDSAQKRSGDFPNDGPGNGAVAHQEFWEELGESEPISEEPQPRDGEKTATRSETARRQEGEES